MTTEQDGEQHAGAPVEGASEETLRVLALLDASGPSLQALQAAVDLAAARRAELLALFVEDINLLRSAAFPFARELGGLTGRPRPLDPGIVEDWLRRQGERVSAALQAAVHGRSIRHTLRVARGQVVAETLALASRRDLLVLGRAGASAAFGLGMGSTSRALIHQAPCSVLIWDESRPLRAGPVLLVTGGQETESVGEVWRIQVLLEWLAARGIAVGLKRLGSPNPARLVELVNRERGGALILTRGYLETLGPGASDVLDQMELPVIVMR
ncbi:MAG: universal stress protein [Ectothiorhodospiraceae bacterium]|nr:universal stress protein [Ectothiorhodospiraceae bacterium]